MKKKHLLVGPLPPGWGGARVSFKMFYDYVQSRSKEEIEHCNLPVRSVCYKDALGKINHFKTVCIVLACLFRIPYVSNVIVFGSKNFCCSYGLLFLLVSKLFRKPFHVRFFGGHPAQNVIYKCLL